MASLESLRLMVETLLEKDVFQFENAILIVYEVVVEYMN